MIKPLFVLLVCFIANALAENTILSVSPTFSQTNAKNYVFFNDRTVLSVEVSVGSYAKDDELWLRFVDVEDNESMYISPHSACVSADNNVVFSLSKGYLVAAADILAPTVCTFQARVNAKEHNIVFTRVSDGNKFFAITPFTTIKPSIEGFWSSSLARVGDVHTFTIKGSLPFAAKETFIVTASNGAPFTAATTCMFKSDALFSVSAQGSRMLFSARVALPEGFECQVRVTVGPTSILQNHYSFSAPEHGYSTADNVYGIMSVLNTADFHPRMGLIGAVPTPRENYNDKQTSLPEATAETNVATAPAHATVRTAAASASVAVSSPSTAAAASKLAARGDGFQSKPMTVRAAKLKAKKIAKAAGKRVRRTKEERVDAMDKAQKSFAASKAKSTMKAASLDASTPSYDNIMYLALPASTVRVGDTVKLYYYEMYGMDMGPCGHKNGTHIGTQEFVFENIDFANSYVTASLTITAPPQVSKDNYVELYCPFTITDTSDYGLELSLIGVRGGIFSATVLDDEIEEYDFFDSGAEFGASVYGKDLAIIDASFSLDSSSDYIHYDIDVTLRGMNVADMDAFSQMCVFYYNDNNGMQKWTATGVAVTDGNVRVKMGSTVLVDIESYLYLHCHSAAAVGETVSVFDNNLNKIIVSETVHAGSMRITYGDGVQTHYLDMKATATPSPLPFILDIDNVYHQAAVDNGYTGLTIRAESYTISTPYHGNSDTFDLECSSGKVRTYQFQGSYGSPYARTTYYVDGFNAKCKGTVNIGVINTSGDESQNRVRLDMTTSDGYSDYQTEIFKSYPTIVQTPKIIAPEQFSFYASSVSLGSSASFSVGHTLLNKDGEFTLTFDHDVQEVSSTCAADMTVVLNCSLSPNKRSLTCVKQDVQTTNPCTMSLAFADDVSRTIAVTTSFKGLPEGMVFYPTFSIAAGGGSSDVTVSSTYSGCDYHVTITLPRVPRITDVLNITHVANADGMTVFSHFEPSIGDSAAAAYVKDGFIVIPLTALDTAEATGNYVKLYFRHIATGTTSNQAKYVYFHMNNALLASKSISFTEATHSIGYVPSSVSSIFPVVAITYSKMAIGDTITINDLTYPVDQPPQLYCTGLEGPITAVNSIFTIPALLADEQSCYAVFPAYTLTKGYWSFTINSVAGTYIISHMAATTDAPAIVLSPSQPPYVKDLPVRLGFSIGDFTTGTLTQDSSISFSFDPTIMSVQKVSCYLFSSSLEGVIDGDIVTVALSSSSVPFSTRNTMTCTVSLTPLVATTDAKFTSFSVLGKTASDLALPVFRAALEPSVSLVIADGGTTYLIPFTSVAVVLLINEMTLNVGDTFSLALEGNDGELDLTSCTNADLVNDKITVTQPTTNAGIVSNIVCHVQAAYTSYTPVPVTVTWTRGATTKTFTASVPPSSESMVFPSFVSQTLGQVTYQITTRQRLPVSSTKSFIVSTHATLDDYVLTTNCSASAQGGSKLYLPFTISKGETEASCLLTLTLDGSYDPAVDEKAHISLTDPISFREQLVALPALKSNKSQFKASFNSVRATMRFQNNDVNTVTVSNVWSIQATTDTPVILWSSVSGAEAGKLVTSADGKLLTASFNANAMTLENGKYTLNEPCYFNTTGIHGMPLYNAVRLVTFTSGSHSVSVWSEPFIPGLMYSKSEAKVIPGSTYTVVMVMRLVGNPAIVTVNHANTALASVESCGVAMDAEDVAMSAPLTVTAKGTSFSFALSETNTLFTEGDLMLGLRCVFNTISSEEAQKKAASLINGIFVTVKTNSGTILLPSSHVAVATPYFAPKVALSHSASFSRSALFNSTEIAVLSKAYAAGLRRSVNNLKDNQITIANQRLFRTPSSVMSVPSPIKTLFNVNTEDTTVAVVAFTITPTDEAPVTVTDINTASTDLAAAFADAGISPASLETPDETIVDGECTYRCGLGCSLCVEGSTCSTHADCIDGTCNVNNVCGPEPEYVPPTDPDNAASATTVSMALLAAVVIAAFMF